MKGVEALRVGIWLAVAADVFILAAVAFALPADQAAFKQLYAPKDGTALASAGCLVCHDKMPPSKTALNPYGKDLAKQATPRTAAAFKAIENLDSDADGATNLKEIEAGMLPGDPSSKPGK